MTLEEFLAAREADRAFAFANGYNNGDPATNGEYACLDLLLGAADLFVDVGANAGLFLSRALSREPRPRLLAFEPNPQHAAALRSLIGQAGTLETVALSDAPGRATLHVHPTHHATASLTDRPRMSPRFRAELRPVDVEVRRLDDYALKADRLAVKIDAEGFELPVMRGAERTLAACVDAAVMFEYSFAWQETGQSMLEGFQLLDRLGFDLYRILPLGLEHVRFFTNEMERAQYCNYVALKGFEGLRTPAQTLATPFGETSLRLF